MAALPALDGGPAAAVAPQQRRRKTDANGAPRFDLVAIEAALCQLQQAFPSINPRLKDRRDPLVDAVVANMLAGYAFIDEMLVGGVDLFAMGQLKQLLELNGIVLCGRDPAVRVFQAEHLRATEQRFYDQAEGGIRDIIEWQDRNRHASVWDHAAGVFTRILSEPQLYLEGNHRTGTLIMSYILGRRGHPPVVLTPANAQAFFDPSTLVKQTRKGSVGMLFRMPGLKKRLARFLQESADKRYLLAAR